VSKEPAVQEAARLRWRTIGQSVARRLPGLCQSFIPLIGHILSTWQDYPDTLAQTTTDMYMLILHLLTIISEGSDEDACSELPLMPFLVRIIVGDTVVTSMPLQHVTIDTFRRIPASILRRQVRDRPCRELPQLVCRAIVGCPTYDAASRSVFALVALGTTMPIFHSMELWDENPYLYESAAHVLLSNVAEPDIGVQKGANITAIAGAIHLLSTLGNRFPRRNVIETIFWHLTESLRILSVDSQRVGIHVSPGLTGTPGNRVAFLRLLSLCTPEEQQVWQIFGHQVPKVPLCSFAPLIDNISSQPARRLYRLKEGTEPLVSLETLVRQFASRGFIDPFSNEPTSWKEILEVNDLVDGRDDKKYV